MCESRLAAPVIVFGFVPARAALLIRLLERTASHCVARSSVVLLLLLLLLLLDENLTMLCSVLCFLLLCMMINRKVVPPRKLWCLDLSNSRVP